MKVLIWGLGSIGQRHLRNLFKIEPKIEFFALRKKFTTPFLNNLNVPQKGNIQKKYNITYLSTINDLNKLKIKIDAAFICTPSKFHINQAIQLIDKNINIFIEKPLGSNLININNLKQLLKRKNKIKNMMGFQLKFDPIILNLKSIVEKNKLGKIYTIDINHGEHLADFHQYEDYSNSYAAKKNLGGGVLLTQIHELDYLYFIFQNYKFKILNSISYKISDLNIDVDDLFVGNLIIKKNKNKIICNIRSNYFERPKTRIIKIIGSEGKIEADLNKKMVITSIGKKVTKKKFNYSRNEVFLKEIKYFLNCIKKNKPIEKFYNVYNGIKSLKLAIQLKKKSIKK